ncbi:hypothetical protein AB0H83_31445 [Dactylosporangium sp. NPDC050688]|uniref:hypothetical protein n=1 Tax=Dactylosporangium sp. NPDC050688 TaxID=3157217 RepID=UPI0033E8942D
MRTAQLLATFTAAAAVLFTAACGGDDPAPTSAQNGAAAGGLTYDTVAKLASERLTKDPNCPIGKWDDNSTGLDDAFKADGVFFKQFDCYKTANELLPNRIQQVIFVEFKTPERAAAYADKQASLYPSLVAGTKVVVAGTGLETIDMKAFLAEAQQSAGGAGKIVG